MYQDNSSKFTYYANLVIRKIQTFFVTTPEAGFVGMIVVGIIVIFFFAKLFLHLP